MRMLIQKFMAELLGITVVTTSVLACSRVLWYTDLIGDSTKGFKPAKGFSVLKPEQ